MRINEIDRTVTYVNTDERLGEYTEASGADILAQIELFGADGTEDWALIPFEPFVVSAEEDGGYEII